MTKLRNSAEPLYIPALKLAIFTVLVAIAGSVIVTTILAPVPGTSQHFLARFGDVSGLYAGDDVRMAGVSVGKVSAIDREGDEAVVKYSVRDDVPMRVSTGAAIFYKNLTGQRYLALLPGDASADVLPDEAEIERNRTVDAYDVTRLFNGFKPLLAELDPDAVNRFAENLLHLVQQDGNGAAAVVDSLASITDGLVSRGDLINSLIASLSTLSGELSGKSADIVAILTRLEQTLAHLTSEMPGVLNAVHWANRTLTPAIAIIEDLEALWDDNLDPLSSAAGRIVPGLPHASDVLRLIPSVFATLRAGGSLASDGLDLCARNDGTPIEVVLCK
ncbi:MCE family protein [Rhodococcus erythropolis]|uniref:MlaD family protein n=1 Tax=Rhodococcus erythropolis TaxID=1833 RepID=UPI00210EA1F3|nr:MlaD family protein [Rhodococcus erythropolis]MCQ4127662.1 MCE family protein [Rhodococcus erythropolis]